MDATNDGGRVDGGDGGKDGQRGDVPGETRPAVDGAVDAPVTLDAPADASVDLTVDAPSTGDAVGDLSGADAVCVSDDSVCTGGCSWENDNDCNPFKPLVGKTFRNDKIPAGRYFQYKCNITTGICRNCANWSRSNGNFAVTVQVVEAGDGSIQVQMINCEGGAFGTCGEGKTTPYGRATLSQISATSFLRSDSVYIDQSSAYAEPGGLQVELSLGENPPALRFFANGYLCLQAADLSGSDVATSFNGYLTE